MKYSAVIFDFDFTLGDSSDGIVECANYALKKMGYDYQDRETIKKTIGLSLEATYKSLTGDVDEKNASMFLKYFMERSDEIMVKSTYLYDESKIILDKLINEKCKIGIVSTKYHPRIVEIMEKFGYAKNLDVVVGADDVVNPKPAPDGLIKAIQILGVPQDQILYVGDNVVDAMAASAAKLDFAGVLTGTTTASEFENYKYKYLSNNLSDLLNKL